MNGNNMAINTLTEDFEQLFDKAGLNEIEKEFFADDVVIAIWEDFKSAKDYYLDWNTQFCLVNYVKDKYKEMARNGLAKILKVLEGEE